MVCKPPPDQGPHHVCRATASGRKREISLRRLLKNTRVWIPYVLTGVNAPFNFSCKTSATFYYMVCSLHVQSATFLL